MYRDIINMLSLQQNLYPLSCASRITGRRMYFRFSLFVDHPWRQWCRFEGTWSGIPHVRIKGAECL